MVGGRRPAHQPRNNNRYSTKNLDVNKNAQKVHEEIEYEAANGFELSEDEEEDEDT
jgi:hypothetical protein